jgi:predicted nuclease of predicted toxin-antitoxin system
VQNDPKRLRKLKNKLEFSRSIVAIAVAKVKETSFARKVADVEIRALAPSTKAILVAKDMDM